MTEILKLLIDTLNDGKDFAVTQAPDIAKQMLYVGLLQCIGWTVVSCIWLFLTCSWLKMVKDSTSFSSDAEKLVACVVLRFMMLIAILVVVANVCDGFAIIAGPKLYVLKQACALLP